MDRYPHGLLEEMDAVIGEQQKAERRAMARAKRKR